MDFPYRIPGTTEPEITVRRSALGNLSVLVGGTPLKRRGRSFRYDVPLADGTTTELEISGQWRGLKAKANGVETALEPPVPIAYVALILIPLALVVIGGLIGGVIALLTSMTNMVISRKPLAGPIKLLVMIGVVVAGVVAYFAVAFAITPVPRVAIGDCLNGVHAGADMDATTLRAVSCATAHENEVVASVDHPGSGAFPGEQALFDYAQTPCTTGFEAYVGLSFEASDLDVTVVVPSDVTWLKGDRTILCVVSTVDGSQLTGSVKGAAR